MEHKEIIIDAKGCVFGRVASFAAKKALQGNKIVIVNAAEAVITGKKKEILNKFHEKFFKGGTAQKGPFYPRVPERLMKRMIRGMLPWKKTKGREAFKNIICFNEVPEEYNKKEKIVFAKADAINFITFAEICRKTGKYRE